jgi:CheY-like chemotaxis protein
MEQNRILRAESEVLRAGRDGCYGGAIFGIGDSSGSMMAKREEETENVTTTRVGVLERCYEEVVGELARLRRVVGKGQDEREGERIRIFSVTFQASFLMDLFFFHHDVGLLPGSPKFTHDRHRQYQHRHQQQPYQQQQHEPHLRLLPPHQPNNAPNPNPNRPSHDAQGRGGESEGDSGAGESLVPSEEEDEEYVMPTMGRDRADDTGAVAVAVVGVAGGEGEGESGEWGRNVPVEASGSGEGMGVGGGFSTSVGVGEGGGNEQIRDAGAGTLQVYTVSRVRRGDGADAGWNTGAGAGASEQLEDGDCGGTGGRYLGFEGLHVLGDAAGSVSESAASAGTSANANTNTNAYSHPHSHPHPRNPRPRHAAAWAVPPRVLLVDDDAVSRRLSSKFLQVFGCAIDVAVDGVGAVDKTRMNLGGYDLVLMVSVFFSFFWALLLGF